MRAARASGRTGPTRSRPGPALRRRVRAGRASRVSAVARSMRARRSPPPQPARAGRASARASRRAGRRPRGRAPRRESHPGSRARRCPGGGARPPAPPRRNRGRRGSSCATRAASRPSARRQDASRSRSSITGAASGGVRERSDRQCGRQRRDRCRRLPRVQLRGDLCRRERIADSRPREPEQLRERSEHDHVVVEQRHRGRAAVLEVRLVDDERPRVRQPPSSPVGLLGLQANVTAAPSSETSAPARSAAIRNSG